MKKYICFISCLLFAVGYSINTAAQLITTVVGGGGSYGDGGPATAAQLTNPTSVFVDAAGNQLIADFGGSRVRKVNSAGIITTLAGAGAILGDGGPATASQVGQPTGICEDLSGNIYIAEQTGCRIRKINTSGIITTIAGNGTCSTSGDGGLATAATVSECTGIITDGSGNIYIADWGNGRIRMINSSGYISTIAGGGAVFGDGGQATAAILSEPYGISLDGLGNLFIGLEGQNRVRMINLSTGIITTVAGTGTGTYTGDGGPATAATMFEVNGIYANATNFYITVGGNNCVRAVNRATGIITTLAGSSGTAGFGGDGGLAATATLYVPAGVMLDNTGNVYIADFDNHRIRKVFADRAPYFTGGTSQTISVCEDGAHDTINSALAIVDSDVGQTETWGLLLPPGHGTATVSGTMTSNGGAITPSGLSYSPATGYSGSDSFKVTVNDGFMSDTITIYVTVIPEPLTITGTGSVCVGTTTALSDSVSAGAWSSGSTGIATIGSSSGIVTGAAAGTATISYSVTLSCGLAISTTIVTVDVTPGPITGPAAITSGLCAGATAMAGNSVPGGAWSSGNTGVATIGSTGSVTGVIPGTAVISYTMPGGCFASATVTVLASPSPIIGLSSVCLGSSLTWRDTSGSVLRGGVWTESPATLVAFYSLLTNDTSAYITGFTVGSGAITYTLSNGCATTKAMTVNALPGAITGGSVLCAGSTIPLSDGGTGTWSSGNHAVATIDGTGTVYGVTAGTAIISFTSPTSCYVTFAITVNPLPSAIGGMTTLCNGATAALSDSLSGGFWSSSNTAIATIDPFAGIVTGLFPSSVTITYTSLSTGCTAVTSMTINPSPGAIVVPATLCMGYAASLGEAASGGIWSSSNTTVATVVSTGPFAGQLWSASPGGATVSYTLADGCASSDTVIVYASPAPITGVSEVCAGLATLLSDDSTRGTWSSSNTTIATIIPSSGILTGASAGVATISYTLSGGCAVILMITVNTTPPVITGVTHACPGTTTSLFDAGGGSWSSSNTAIATVGPTGVVGGITIGTASILYSIGAGCSISTTITVNALPPAIGGVAAVCAGSTTALSDGAGTWSSGNTAIATVGSASGIVNGIISNTVTVAFTAATTGCSSHTTVTINPLPQAITGTLPVCFGATTSLNDLTTGGNWSSSSTVTATIGSAGSPSTGVVTGLAPGTSVITYTNPVTGCSRTAVVTVNPLPSIPAAAGPLSICVGATTTLTDATSGGLWTSAPGSIATVIPTSGVVSGVSAGTAFVSYTLSTGCSRPVTVTVNLMPTAITGPTAECVGATIVETVLPAGIGTGGTWNSSVTSVATVNGTGSVTGVATGTTMITFTSSAGCKATTIITVSLSPTGITGSPTACADDTTTMGDAVWGGAWSTSNTAAATIGSLNGTVTGVASGTTVITYSLGTGCTVTRILSVNAAPSGISGGMAVCIGSTTVLADATTGGAWSSNTTGVATVAAGVVGGLSSGTSIISYLVGTTGCSARAVVTVNPTPLAIAGTPHVCAGTTTGLSDAITGGVWTSSNTAIASVTGSGNVTGASPGTSTITYSLGAGCAVTQIITVNPITAITGSTGICLGATTNLYDATTGGTWASGTAGTATVNATGMVTGALAGTSIITYTTGAGCTATAIITVNLAPSAISGTLHVCAGATTALGNTAGGGTWTSSSTTVATVNGSGVVTGLVPGTAVITYSLGSGCTATAAVTVNAGADAITGTINICNGTTTVLGDATTGGVWSSVPATIATVTTAGMATGLAAGIASITYTPVTGCASIAIVTVNPVPGSITGTMHVCAGLTATLSSDSTGGSWSSSNTAVMTTDPVTGIIGGVTPGPAVITYTLPAGCSATAAVTINAAPAAITGSMAVCIGSATLLDDRSGSGAWSGGSAGIAEVSVGAGGAGVVMGIGLGTATISYTAGGCVATAVVTINSLPDALGGTNLCAGATAALTDLPGSGTWSSSDAGIATIDELTGELTGAATGAATISYSLGAGCTVTETVIVNPLPGAITGVTEVCLGYTTAFHDAAGGGIWSSSNTAIATITGSGIVSGVVGGPATISYTSTATGCAATRLVTVIAVPAITGVSDICAFSAVMAVSDAITGGTWTSTSATVSTTGIVTSYSAGAATLTYTIPSGCYTTAAFTVHPLPGPVTGDFRFCRGLSVSLADTTSGGTWSSSNSAVAVVNAGAGAVMGVSAGTATISYVLATGCMETEVITVDSIPVAGTISGPSNVCVGVAIALTDGAAGGVWNTSNAYAAVFGGLVSGISAGVDTIRYVVSNSCGSAAAAASVTVNPLPEAGTITGPASVCAGDSITLGDAATGGAWSSSGATATVSIGIAHGVSAGADSIKYTVTNSCGTAIATKILTVNALPATPGSISGIDTLCNGFTFTLGDAVTGGVWSSSNGSLSISAAGSISALSAGVDTVTYSLSDVCGTVSASSTIVVKDLAAADSISGTAVVCEGAKDTLTGTPPGGIWTSSNTNVTVTATTTGVIVSGVSPGADTIIYAMVGECNAAAAVFPITVLSLSQCEETSPQPAPKEREMLRVWPNPNEGTFSVILSSSVDERVEIVITNIIGEKVREVSGVSNKTMELQMNDAVGVYFISVSTAEGNYVAKVAVEK